MEGWKKGGKQPWESGLGRMSKFRGLLIGETAGLQRGSQRCGTAAPGALLGGCSGFQASACLLLGVGCCSIPAGSHFFSKEATPPSTPWADSGSSGQQANLIRLHSVSFPRDRRQSRKLPNLFISFRHSFRRRLVDRFTTREPPISTALHLPRDTSAEPFPPRSVRPS